MYFNNRSLFVADTPDLGALKDWREHQHSLTDKLVSLKGIANLELLFQDWVKTSWWDTYCLQIDDELVYQREILMRSEKKPYWYARTVIPQKCDAIDPAFFNRLQQESVRNLIFDEPDVQRVDMICYPVNKMCFEFYWVKKYIPAIEGTLWARLSEHRFKNKASFYLVELLLPELENL